MKFVSKSSNLLVVLRPGFSAQPLTGTPAKPTISVRFKDGLADVQQEELVEMMLAHPGFNGDFISAEDIATDPYASLRKSAEPDHVLTEIQFGTPIKREVKSQKSSLPPEIQKMIQNAAAEMAKEMLPKMVEETLKTLVGSTNVVKGTSKVKGKRGRKPKAKVQESVYEEVVPVTEEDLDAVFGTDERMKDSV